MSERDMFAIEVAIRILADGRTLLYGKHFTSMELEGTAKLAYEIASAMLAARSRGQGEEK